MPERYAKRHEEEAIRERPLKLLEDVDNVELFYDLIFVYCISVLTGLLHHPHAGFLDPALYATYLVSFLIVVQVWMYMTLLIRFVSSALWLSRLVRCPGASGILWLF